MNLVSQRLAAELHKRQIETIIQTEWISGQLEKQTAKTASDWLQIIQSELDPSGKFKASSLLWNRFLVGEMPDFVAKYFEKLAIYSHKTMIAAYAKAVPRNWFPTALMAAGLEALEANWKDVQPLLPTYQREIPAGQFGPNAGGVLGVTNYSEPVAAAGGRIPDDEWAQVLEKVIFPAPDKKTIDRILNTPDPNTGQDWQARLSNLSRKATDVGGLSRQLIAGYAGGENLYQLRQRVLPLVQGIQSSAKRIVRTEGLRIGEQIQREGWKDLGDMLEGAQLLAVLDQHTRPGHAERNGDVYYQTPTKGQKALASMPVVPDEPNCRCWSAPVLKPPEALKTDPGLLAEFKNNQGAGIPDPASYSQWFKGADEKRRMMAVGVRRYRTIQGMVDREPEWSDFLLPDGKLAPVDLLKNETPFERVARKTEIDSVLAARKAQIEKMANRGFFGLEPPTTKTKKAPKPPKVTPEAGSFAAVREENKKALAKLRANVVKEAEKGLNKLGAAVAADLDAREAVRDQLMKVNSSRKYIETQRDLMLQDPENSILVARVAQARLDYAKDLKDLKKLETQAAKTAKGRIKARELEASGTSNVMQKEISEISKEDKRIQATGRAADGVLGVHKHGGQIDDGADMKFYGDPEKTALCHEISKYPETVASREAAQKFLRG